MLGLFDFFLKRLDDGCMDGFAGFSVHRVCDIRVQFGAAPVIPERAALREAGSAFAAETGSELVLGAALGTVVAQLAARHGHKHSLSSLDNFQVADDEGIVNRDGAECLQFVPAIIHELDADFCDFHGVFSSGVWS